MYLSTSKENMILDDFNARIKTAHDIINLLNNLIQIEKSTWLSSSSNETNRKKSKLFWYLPNL